MKRTFAAVITACPQRAGAHVVTSKLLPRPVTMRKGGNLLIKVTDKTNPGKYRIMLLCVGPRRSPLAPAREGRT